MHIVSQHLPSACPPIMSLNFQIDFYIVYSILGEIFVLFIKNSQWCGSVYSHHWRRNGKQDNVPSHKETLLREELDV